jgi:hypothetical protein
MRDCKDGNSVKKLLKDVAICAPIKIIIKIIPVITKNTANPEGICFSFNQSIGGMPSDARKTETRNKTTMDCARLIPAIIITIAAMLTNIRTIRNELFDSFKIILSYIVLKAILFKVHVVHL